MMKTVEAPDSPFRGAIHNVKTYAEGVAPADPKLYALLVEGSTTYELPVDAPIYASIVITDPDDSDK